MAASWFRRYRMEFDFSVTPLRTPVLPEPFAWRSWHPTDVQRHASVKHASFEGEVDPQVFPALGTAEGCRELMQSIAAHAVFLPQATWLVTRRFDEWAEPQDCATIQGVRRSTVLGSVQNVGVIPGFRGCGLGTALVLKSLHGFRDAGLNRVYLEVTARNEGALRLYEAVGFRLTRTLYKQAEQPVEFAIG